MLNALKPPYPRKTLDMNRRKKKCMAKLASNAISSNKSH